MDIRLKGKQNVSQSIVEEYKKLISLGAIRRGEKLPSCRALAVELGVNPNTVEKAYTALEEEGYILILPQKGAYADYVRGDREREEVESHLSVLKNAGIPYAKIKDALDRLYGSENAVEASDSENPPSEKGTREKNED